MLLIERVVALEGAETNIYPVILCNGSDTRLWPASHGGYPKQYLKLIGKHMLVQQTVFCLRGIGNVATSIVIIDEKQRLLMIEQLRNVDVKPSAIALKPVDHDTAPAVTVAALLTRQAMSETLLLILPLDCVIKGDVMFDRLATIATSVAKDNFLITFGIEPTESYMGYGYTHGGEALVAVDGTYRIERFVEKPDTVIAARLLEEDGYCWDSGMFMLRVTAYLDELRQHVPKILRQARLVLNTTKRGASFVWFDTEALGASPKLSIDHAIMEKAAYAVIITVAGLGWNNVGSWAALTEIANVDDNGNVLFGDMSVEDARNTCVRVGHHVVTATGVNDLVITETADAILVSHRDRIQNIKKIIERLSSSGHHESVTHRKAFRPQGSHKGIDQGERFQVKHIIANLGLSLSLQMHHHRAEYWIVVCGTTKVPSDDQVMLLSENQLTYIPPGVTHRLEDPGKIPLGLIEV